MAGVAQGGTSVLCAQGSPSRLGCRPGLPWPLTVGEGQGGPFLCSLGPSHVALSCPPTPPHPPPPAHRAREVQLTHPSPLPQGCIGEGLHVGNRRGKAAQAVEHQPQVLWLPEDTPEGALCQSPGSSGTRPLQPEDTPGHHPRCSGFRSSPASTTPPRPTPSQDLRLCPPEPRGRFLRLPPQSWASPSAPAAHTPSSEQPLLCALVSMALTPITRDAGTSPESAPRSPGGGTGRGPSEMPGHLTSGSRGLALLGQASHHLPAWRPISGPLPSHCPAALPGGARRAPPCSRPCSGRGSQPLTR